MKKRLLFLLLLAALGTQAQINTYVLTQTGQAEFDTLRPNFVHLDTTRDGLDARILGMASNPNSLTIATMTSTLDVTKRNGVNSALYLSTVAAKILSNNLGISHANNEGLDLVNTAAATAGGAANQQISPALWFEGQGWKTNATAASQSVRFKIYNNPAEGAAAPTGNLVFTSKINAAGENVVMQVGSRGDLFVNSLFEPTGGTEVFNSSTIGGLIDQTGGGTGITRGLHINNTLAATPADYRALEITNIVGKSIVTSAAPSSFGGTIQGTYLTASEMLITDGSKNIVSAPVATYPSLTELSYLKGATSAVQTQLNGKQSTITFGTGVQTALGVNIGSAGAPVLFNGAGGTPSSMTGTNITGTASGLTAGNVTTNANLTGVVTSVGNTTSFATSPAFTGNATVTNTTDVTLGAESALRVGGAANSTNLTLGEYSTGVGLQARNNGAVGSLYINPFGGTIHFGEVGVTGSRLFIISNPGANTGDFSGWEVRNGTTNSGEALAGYTTGTAFTTSGMNVQDAGVLRTGTSLSGGMSIGTQAASDLREYTNNTLRRTVTSAGYTNHTNRLEETQATVASANNLTLTTANHFLISGTTQINAITTTDWQAGAVVSLQFQGALTVKNNTAGGAGTAVMRLAGAADFTTSALDTLTLKYDGTQWVELSRSNN